jgi:hypothetical protein
MIDFDDDSEQCEPEVSKEDLQHRLDYLSSQLIMLRLDVANFEEGELTLEELKSRILKVCDEA